MIIEFVDSLINRIIYENSAYMEYITEKKENFERNSNENSMN